ncbi:ABC transporter ATP-binding protein [Corynebacterium bovis]|uniref:ABC transporter ATP-binding protein n=1 Tax=Corynebacterium bovis TaxID=36808 RepID=UPI002449BA92|nr:ABC transporter ATP-binding protein [Corynebacterium bovis]MDH2455047.1 ABC transporter ATP-binding protein [Corynebacterium bovis]
MTSAHLSPSDPVEDTPPRLSTRSLSGGYARRPVLHSVDVHVPDGGFTVIVGPNACGKSTLLRSLARMLPVREGQVVLDGRPITDYRTKEVARRLAVLPQSPTAPEGITVGDLVSRGRYPHQGLFRQWSPDDRRAVDAALRATGTDGLADRPVSDLSGGQRQKVWIATALAQDTPILLLDEPTTFLDIAHQIEVLTLARSLHREGTTVVMVLHELALAFRYATHLIVMKEGRVVAQGPVADVVTEDLIREVYDLPCRILPDPVSGRPIVVPLDPDDADDPDGP